MGNPKRIELSSSEWNMSGIVVEYIKSRKELCIWGWYDSCVGIAPQTISLDDFCEKLGIDLKRKCK